MPIKSKLEQHALKTPHKTAFVIGDEYRTYQQMAQGSRVFSDYLYSLPGNRAARKLLNRIDNVVALCIGNHLLFPEIFIAATEAPMACAVVNPEMKPHLLKEIFEKLRPDLVVSVTANDMAADVAAQLSLNTVTVDGIENRGLEGIIPVASNSGASEDEPFLISFTSGTTARPKAFFRSRGSWLNSLKRSEALFGLTTDTATMCPCALAHGVGLYAMTETLHSGGTFHCVERWDAQEVVQRIATANVQRLVAVPTMVESIIKRAELAEFTSVKEIVTAGSKLMAKHVEMIKKSFPQAAIREYYGASELGFVTVLNALSGLESMPITSVGCAFPGVEISIRDEAGRRVGYDIPGTIYVRSDLISDGYLWGDDGLAFRRNSAGATVGDIGRMSENGVLTILGRQGGMVITGGHNVYPSEVEEILVSLEGVDQAIVLDIDDDYLGKRLIAVVQGNFCNLDTILIQSAQKLPRYKIPREFYQAQSFPYTASGKIARSEVRESWCNGAYEHV